MPANNSILQYRIAGLTAPRVDQRRFINLLLTGILAGGLTLSLVIGSFAAILPSAHTPIAASAWVIMKADNLTAPMALNTNPARKVANIQPMPPLPEQAYDAQRHEGSVELEADDRIAGVDPFITGPGRK